MGKLTKVKRAEEILLQKNLRFCSGSSRVSGEFHGCGDLGEIYRSDRRSSADSQCEQLRENDHCSSCACLGTFVFGILAEFGALLGPGTMKTALIE